jgi:hypothetical protein
MEIPQWAFKAESRVRSSGVIDVVFSLRPLGRLWLVWCALVDLIRTRTITIAIEFQERRPIVTHEGEEIKPTLVDEPMTTRELYEIVRSVPAGAALDELIQLAQERRAMMQKSQ